LQLEVNASYFDFTTKKWEFNKQNLYKLLIVDFGMLMYNIQGLNNYRFAKKLLTHFSIGKSISKQSIGFPSNAWEKIQYVN